MENSFTSMMNMKSDSDLMYYIEHKSQFQVEAVIAAIDELEIRGITNSKLKDIRNVSLEKLVKESKEESKSKPQINFKIPKDSPKTISVAIKLIYVAIGVILLGLFILGITTDFFVDRAYEKVYFTLVVIGINLGVIEGIIRRKKTSKFLLILSIILEGILFLTTLIYIPVFMAGLSILITLGLQFYSLTLLYKSDSIKWFKIKK